MTDTAQQKAVLRQSVAARKVRAKFPVGARVTSAHHDTGRYGTVLRHVPNSNAQGGYLVVQWDDPAFDECIGRHSAVSLRVVS